MDIDDTSLPTTKWAGEAPTRTSGLAEKTVPDAWDWDRLLREFIILQDMLPWILYANEAVSSKHTNTVAAADLDKKYTLPANAVGVGDTLVIRARGIVDDNNSTDTLTLLLNIGAVTLATIGPTDAADNDEFYFEAELFVTASNKALVVGRQSDLEAPASWTITNFAAAAQTIDFTATQLIAVNADWSVAHADNQVKLTQLTVERKQYRAP